MAPEACIVSEDPVLCSSGSADANVSREILGAPDPLIQASSHAEILPQLVTDESHIDGTNVSREILGAPGPLIQAADTFTITSRNIRNLLIHRQDVFDCTANIQVLQECDLLEHQQSIVNDTLAQLPWQRHYGDVTDISATSGKKRGRRVATLVNDPMDNAIHLNTDDPDYKFLKDSGRWVEVTVPTSEKGHHITVANFYGISGANQKSEEFKMNERLIAAGARRAASMPKHPYFSLAILM